MYDDSWGYMPCREDVDYWLLDKPTVVGELPATDGKYTAEELVNCSYANGFAGTLFWAYTGTTQVPRTRALHLLALPLLLSSASTFRLGLSDRQRA